MEGSPFHGEFHNAVDASGLTEPNQRFTLYGNRSKTALTLGANDIVVICDMSISTGATLTVTIFDGADNTADPGEAIFNHPMAANVPCYPNLFSPHECQIGTYPKVKTSGAGVVDAVIHGFIKTKTP